MKTEYYVKTEDADAVLKAMDRVPVSASASPICENDFKSTGIMAISLHPKENREGNDIQRGLYVLERWHEQGKIYKEKH